MTIEGEDDETDSVEKEDIMVCYEKEPKFEISWLDDHSPVTEGEEFGPAGLEAIKEVFN